MGHPVNKAYPKDRRVMAPSHEPKIGLLLPQTDGKKMVKVYITYYCHTAQYLQSVPHCVYIKIANLSTLFG